MYFDVRIAQKITQNAENHIFEVLDFQIFLRGIASPPRNVCDLSDMHQSEKSLDPRLVRTRYPTDRYVRDTYFKMGFSTPMDLDTGWRTIKVRVGPGILVG